MSSQDPFAEGSLFSKLIGKSWSSWQLPDQPAESDLKKSKSVLATSVTSNPLGGDYRDLFGTHPDRDYFSLTTCPACRLVMKVQYAGRHFLRDSAGFLVCKDKEQVVSNGKVLNKKPSLPLGTLNDSSKKITLGVKSSPMGPPAPVQKPKQKKVQSLPLICAHPVTSLSSPKSDVTEAQTINQIKKGRTVIISLPKIIPNNQIVSVKNIVNNKTCLEVPASSQSGIVEASKPVIQQQSALSSPSGALQNYDHPVKFYEVPEKRQRKQKLCTSPSSKKPKFSSSLPIYEMNEISNPDLDIPGKAKKKKRERTVSSSSSRSDHSSGSTKKQKTDIKPCNVLIDRSFNPDKHCGVLLPGMSSPCKRNIVCKKKNHSVALRRAVEGRSKPYDDLVSEYKLAYKKEKMEEEKKQEKLKKDDLKVSLLPGALAEPLPQSPLPILSPPPLLSLPIPVQPATTEPKKKKPKKKSIKKVSEERVVADVEPNPNQASPVMLDDVLSEFAHVNIDGANDKVGPDPVANTRKSPLFVYPYIPSSQDKFFELWMNESKELFESMDTQSKKKDPSQDKSPLLLRRDNQPSFIKFDGYATVKSKAGGGPPRQEKRKNVFSVWNPCASASSSSLNEVEATPPDTGSKSQWVDYSLGVANEENDNDMEILFDFIPLKW